MQPDWMDGKAVTDSFKTGEAEEASSLLAEDCCSNAGTENDSQHDCGLGEQEAMDKDIMVTPEKSEKESKAWQTMESGKKKNCCLQAGSVENLISIYQQPI